MENKHAESSALQTKIKNLCTKDIALKLISLLFAILVWGYVMMDENPMRVKTVDNIAASFEGEADMISRKLIIRGNRTEVLSGISSRVNTRLTEYADLKSGDVKATISLRNITEAGVYELPIYPTSTKGDVESTTPNAVEVEIDDLVTKRIPIEYKIIRDLPEGYWAAEPVLSRTEVDVQGPAQDIARIVRGMCMIDLSNRTESYNEAMDITLLDENGVAVDGSVLYGQLASVSVKQTIMHKKTLPVNVASALLGADNLANNYEIAQVQVTPMTVDVAGKVDVLDTLSEITVENIDLASRSESLLASAKLIVPEGVTLTKEDDLVSVYVDIREKQEQLDFAKLPIKIIGAGRGTDVKLGQETADLTITGGTSLLKKINRGDLTLYIDVTDLAKGTVIPDFRIQLKLPDDEMQSQVTYAITPETVSVTIR